METVTGFNTGPVKQRLPILIIVLGVLFFGLSIYLYQRVNNNWESFVHQRNTVNQVHNELIAALGYGGFIHNFKNLVLRRDIERYEKPLTRNLEQALAAIIRLRALGGYQAEAATVIADTIEEYAGHVSLVMAMIQEGASSEQIDSMVAVDDTAALAAINGFQSTMDERLSQRAGDLEQAMAVAITVQVVSSALFLAIIVTYLIRISQARLIEQRLIEQLRASSQAKSDFLSSMSHELRTPMNAVLGFAQLMELDDTLPKEHRQSVLEIMRAGYHLLSLIEDVLNLEAIESGREDLVITPTELDPVIQECIAILEATAEKRHITVSYQPRHTLMVSADRRRLKQVLVNLLSNAVNYNRDGGDISIAVDENGSDSVTISVVDTGPGIPADKLDQLFKPFDRLGIEGGTIAGTGIGLTITRRLVEMMDGQIRVASTEGEGSTFSVTLPLATSGSQGHIPNA